MPQPPNLQKMLQQAQEMMAAQQQAQESLKEERVEASAGGGMVKVVMTGDMRIETLTIDPDAVDPEDVEMLQDLVVAAINEGIRKAEDPANRELIVKAIRSVTGSSLRLVYELREGEVQSVAAAPKLSEEDLVKRFKAEFDAVELPPEPEEQT